MTETLRIQIAKIRQIRHIAFEIGWKPDLQEFVREQLTIVPAPFRESADIILGLLNDPEAKSRKRRESKWESAAWYLNAVAEYEALRLGISRLFTTQELLFIPQGLCVYGAQERAQIAARNCVPVPAAA